MRIQIHHETTYRFEMPASYSVQALHLKPMETGTQKLIRWKLVFPNTASWTETQDVFGNVLHMLYVSRPHNNVTISAVGEVETQKSNGVLTGVREHFNPSFYLRVTPLTMFNDAIDELAMRARKASDGSDLDTAHKLMEAVREVIDYRVGETDARTNAVQALEQGFGVCQDHTHVFLAAARRIGLPARYISGYLQTAPDGEHEAGHAWAEAYIDGLGWVGFDVANRICSTEAYVRVATGLDYLDAAPVRGYRRGGGEESLDVRLKVDAEPGKNAQQ